MTLGFSGPRGGRLWRERCVFRMDQFSQRQTERQNINCRSGGINFGLQLICQLDPSTGIHLDVICWLAGLLAGGLILFPRSLSALVSPARHPARADTEDGARSETVDKLAVLTDTTANADFALLACSFPRLIPTPKDYSS